MNRRHSSCSASAFTLIELMVVVGIIALLIGFLFPVFQGVQNQAKKVQAKNDVTEIVTAVNAFYTEYGKYPIVTTDTPLTTAQLADLFYTLRALALGSANALDAANPRKIVFLTVPDAKDQNAPRSGIKTSDGRWYDPWGNAYGVAIDGTYDNSVANPYSSNAGSNPLQAGVIAWSLGRDKAGGSGDRNTGSNKDDMISWQ